MRGACHDSSFSSYRLSRVRLVKAIHRPSGDQVSSPRPSGIVQTVRTSPEAVIGTMCNVESPFFSPRREVKARNRPSGDQTGLASWSPAVSGASSSHTRDRVVFSSTSLVATTKATRAPSGDTAT